VDGVGLAVDFDAQTVAGGVGAQVDAGGEYGAHKASGVVAVWWPVSLRARISRTQRPLVNQVTRSASWSVLCSPLGWVIVCVFFEPPGTDGFVNRVGQHAKFCADGWNFHSRVEPDLDFLKALLRELVTLPGHRWAKKSHGSLVAQLLAAPLYADQGHSEGP